MWCYYDMEGIGWQWVRKRTCWRRRRFSIHPRGGATPWWTTCLSPGHPPESSVRRLSYNGPTTQSPAHYRTDAGARRAVQSSPHRSHTSYYAAAAAPVRRAETSFGGQIAFGNDAGSRGPGWRPYPSHPARIICAITSAKCRSAGVIRCDYLSSVYIPSRGSGPECICFFFLWCFLLSWHVHPGKHDTLNVGSVSQTVVQH